MKKITLKGISFLFFVLAIMQVNGQFYGEGTYRLRAFNQVGGENRYITDDATAESNYTGSNGNSMTLEALAGSGNSQIFDFVRTGETFELDGNQYAVYNLQGTKEIGGTVFAGVIELRNNTGDTRAALRTSKAPQLNSSNNLAGFIIQKETDGTHKIRSIATTSGGADFGRFLLATGATDALNYDDTGSNRQKWYFEPQTITTNYWQADDATLPKRWTTAENWSKGTVPAATDNVYIPDGQPNDPELPGTLTGGVAKNLVVEPGVTLTISSGSSLIISEKSFGEVSARFNINDTNWHLLASPTEGMEYISASETDWISTYNIDDAGTGDNVGIGTYDNTVDADGDWTYLQSTDNTTKTFTTGQGYAIKRKSPTSGQVRFPGTLKTDDFVGDITIGNVGTGNENRWNLIGNPYTAYISVSDLITANSVNLSGTHQAVYVFNNDKAGGAGYEALSGTDYIHPSQAFFVNANNSTSDNFTITKAMLSDRNSVTYYKGAVNTFIRLFVEAESKKLYTEINYLENKTTGLDPSFDIGTFTGSEASNLDVYTQLISDNQGINFMRQALPNTNFETSIIPIGIKAESGTEITFTSEVLNLPEGIKVYLEDKKTNTFTRIDEANSSVKISLSENLNGIGRFYLHTKFSVLKLNSFDLENISIYKKDNNILKIMGLSQGKSSIKLFNILGKKMISYSFESNGIKEVTIPKLSQGIYMIQLETPSGKLRKKIVLE